MTFKKQFKKEDFLKALTPNFQKTREIADKMGCKNKLVTDTLLQMYRIVPVGFLLLPDGKASRYKVYNTVELVEWKWVPGGKRGTREWKLKELE